MQCLSALWAIQVTTNTWSKDKFRGECAGSEAPASRSLLDMDGQMRLRRAVDVYAGLRPGRIFDALVERTPPFARG